MKVESPLWSPTPAQKEQANLTAFAREAAARGAPQGDYAALHAWSIADPQAFWSAIWDFCGVLGKKGSRVTAGGERLPGTRWFPGARLNYAENLLRRADNAPALIYRGEDGRRALWTFRALRDEVGRVQAALRAAGLQPGERVAAYLPNVPEAIVAFLAVASLGGIWSSCSPDFGAAGVLDRFGQIEPRFLLAADGYFYKGKTVDCLEKLRDIQKGLPSVERTVVLPFAGAAPSLAGLRAACTWPDFLADFAPAPPSFAPFPFDHPLYILYSSGTTGRPKCIVHGAGGSLLQHLKEHQLHTDLVPADRLFYFTTLGWMMWNWLVSGLASGACLVLYEGNPFHPGPDGLWRLAAEEGVTVFGTSAKYLDACRKAGVEPGRDFELGALREILSTGSPLAPESFDWVYRHVKGELQLASISGGTDIVSCFVLGCPILPVHRGEIQCKGLGMAVEVWDEQGKPVVGEAGELVCVKPFPSMPLGFWNDPGGVRFRAAYFEHFPGVWRHGDWAQLTERGGMIIYGRSDATLNPGGVRIGTAEIYRQVEQVAEVEESIAVGQDTEDGDQRIVLFVRLQEGARLDAALEQRIREIIRRNTTPRHVPALMVQVSDIPRTRSGKISELAVREVLHGRPVKNLEALANPEALEQFRLAPSLPPRA